MTTNNNDKDNDNENHDKAFLLESPLLQFL